MSLYASIDVPKDERKTTKRPGFVPLYSDPTTVANEATVVEEAAPSEQVSTVQEQPNAALQFAPSARRKATIPPKRKAPPSSVASAPIHDSEPTSVVSEATRPGSNVPRLEVVNNFEDYADFQPGHGEQDDNHKRGSKRSKKKASVAEPLPGWDDDYDPSRPIDFENYLGSDEHQEARTQWRTKKAELGFGKKKSLIVEQVSNKHASSDSQQRKLNFGPPGKMKLNFAPVIAANVYRAPASAMEETTPTSPPPAPTPSHVPLPPSSSAHIPPPPPPVETAEEAYARRAATSFIVPSVGSSLTQGAPGTFQAPPPPPSQRTTYAAAPTYNPVPPAPSISPVSDHGEEDTEVSESIDAPGSRGSAPGQKGFAQRYMASQGWTKGQGLGSGGSGRLAPLFVKPQKDGKTGKIIDRHRKSSKNASASSQISKVVLLEGMIHKNEVIDEYLQQDVGESCADAYGKVERVKLISETGRVLVKFTDSISALRCMSTVEGREFQGNNVSACYYPEEAFEAGDWTR